MILYLVNFLLLMENLELYCNWSLKLENIAAVTKEHPKELVLGKAQDAVIKCLKSLPAEARWNNV